MDQRDRRSGDAERVVELCRRAFGPGAVTIEGLTDVNRGRGAFSVVLRAELRWLDDGPGPGGAGAPAGHRPVAVVAKLPVPGPNGEAAAASGAYRREALAYRELLPRSPVVAPRAYAVDEHEDGTCALLLEDLTGHRAVDQLDGLDRDDAIRVAEALAPFHRRWADGERLSGLDVRRNTLAGLGPDPLAAGLASLATTWADVLDDEARRTFAAVVAARSELVRRFDRAPATLCHGDPRADNLVFDDEDRPVLFDWQQMAVQFAEADLAWLASTSLETPIRRRVEGDLVDAVGGDRDRYRLGLALPGLAVLHLAQRELPSERARQFVGQSLQRIAAALADHEVGRLG
jgi:aminoglycoside phosphotransferase (APT) family kinase protein